MKDRQEITLNIFIKRIYSRWESAFPFIKSLNIINAFLLFAMYKQILVDCQISGTCTFQVWAKSAAKDMLGTYQRRWCGGDQTDTTKLS